MSGISFHDTVMGKRFFEAQLPDLTRRLAELASQVASLNRNLERIAAALEDAREGSSD